MKRRMGRDRSDWVSEFRRASSSASRTGYLMRRCSHWEAPGVCSVLPPVLPPEPVPLEPPEMAAPELLPELPELPPVDVEPVEPELEPVELSVAAPGVVASEPGVVVPGAVVEMEPGSALELLSCFHLA